MRAHELYEYAEYGDYGGWISPDNKIHGTDDRLSHLDMIEDLGFGSYERAFEEGWIRITWDSPIWNIQGERAAIKRVFRLISRRLFREARGIAVDVMDEPLTSTISLSEIFSLSTEKTDLIKFINGL